MTSRTGAKKRRFAFFRDIIAELRKVVWLTRKEAAYLTFLVILVAAVAGAFLGALDLGFTRLIDSLFLAG